MRLPGKVGIAVPHKTIGGPKAASFFKITSCVEASEYRYDRMIAMKAAVADEGAEKVSEAAAEKTGEAPEKRKKKIGAETSAAKKAEGKPKARKKAKDSDEPKEPKRRARKSEKKEGEEKK